MKAKTVLVTGSSIGIGKATAIAFAKERYNVVVTYNKSKNEAQQCKKECLASGSPNVIVVKLDIKNNKNIKKLVEKIKIKFGKIDILVNNAGVLVYKKLKKQTPLEIENVLRTNLEGMIKMTSEALPLIKTAIVNISSYWGIYADADVSTYVASKWGVRGFSQALAKEIKQKVFVVNPSDTKTQMNDWKGVPPEKVANIVVNAIKGRYNVKSGSDLNVWEL